MPDKAPLPALSDAEHRLVEFWVGFADVLGFPRSVGSVYGLIFTRDKGITADDCVALLGLSRSSAGQALKMLVELGAVRPMRRTGRRESFELESDLGLLVSNIVQRRLFPAMAELSQRMAEARAMAEGDPVLQSRCQKLERWRAKTAPVVEQLKALTDFSR